MTTSFYGPVSINFRAITQRECKIWVIETTTEDIQKERKTKTKAANNQKKRIT